VDSLEYDKVVEIPVDDRGQRQIDELFGLLLEALCGETVLAGGTQDIAGLAAIARDAAGHP
jgi:hypothetical protein